MTLTKQTRNYGRAVAAMIVGWAACGGTGEAFAHVREAVGAVSGPVPGALYFAHLPYTRRAWVEDRLAFQLSVNNHQLSQEESLNFRRGEVGFDLAGPGYRHVLGGWLELGGTLPVAINRDRGPNDLIFPGIELDAAVQIVGNPAVDTLVMAGGLEGLAGAEDTPSQIRPYMAVAGRFHGFSPQAAAGLAYTWATGQSTPFFQGALAYAPETGITIVAIEADGRYNALYGCTEIDIIPGLTFLSRRLPASIALSVALPVAGREYKLAESFRFRLEFTWNFWPGGGGQAQEGSGEPKRVNGPGGGP